MNKLQRYFRKNSPIIMACVGAAGVVVTTILAIKATPKAVQLLEEAEEEKKELEEDFTVVDKIRIAGPVYIPTMLAGVTTVGCILGSSVLSHRQQVSLMSAYTVIDASYKKYKDKLKELYGKESDACIQDAISRDRFAENPIQVTDGKLLWYEPYRDEFFEMTEKEVIDAEYHTNRSFILRGETNLNEFYEFLGLDPTDAGCDIGWNVNVDEFAFDNTWIDFEHHLVRMDDGSEYYRIEIVFPPEVASLPI